ncbi:minor tail protein [Mycobacterium phage Reptar3000]|nr:minor tail protein [Mycobacterium phage Reptar3000]
MMATILKPPAIGVGGAPDPVKAPLSAYRYLDARRDVIDEEAKARPLIRLWDKHMRYIGTVAAEKSVDAEEMLHDTGQGDIVLRADDWLVDFLRTDVRKDEDLHITIDPYPNRRNWRWRWGAKVVNVRVKRDENGTRSVVFECAHNREHWKHLYFGATPFMDPSVQPIKAWLLPGNTRTIIATTGFINLARNYWPLLALPTNALNPFAWVGEGSNPLNLNPLNWPVQMQFVNPLFDQSRFSVIMSRWSDAHSVTEAMLKDAGCHLRAYTWLEEDEDSPHPELAAIVGEKLARPTRNCIVLAVEDKSMRTGWTGTAFDGIMNLVGAVGDNFVTETVYQVIGNNKVIDPRTNSPAPPIISSLLGTAPQLPRITFREHEHSAIISSEHSMFRAKAQKILTGGKSPGWVNQTQTFLIKYALSQLSNVIQTAIGPEVTGVQNPGTPGLEEIYQGQADNVLLAFIQVTDPVRALASGPYGYLEHFEQGSGTAYTVSSGLTLREGHYKTRPYQAFKVSVRNGRPHTLYYDFDLGDPALFEIDGVLYNDQVSAVRLHYDETTPKTFDLSIGDDEESESPIAQVTRTAQAFWSALAMLFGSGDMF